MPIKGKIVAVSDENCLRNLKIGQEGYIDPLDFTITRQAIFIDLVSFVELKEEDDDDDDDWEDYVVVKRISEGFTEDDFEFDLSLLSKDYEFALEGTGTYLDLMKEKHMYIVFPDFKIDMRTSLHRKRKDTLESLEEDLQKALKKDEYEKAEKIQEKIRNLKRTQNPD